MTLLIPEPFCMDTPDLSLQGSQKTMGFLYRWRNRFRGRRCFYQMASSLVSEELKLGWRMPVCFPEKHKVNLQATGTATLRSEYKTWGGPDQCRIEQEAYHSSREAARGALDPHTLLSNGYSYQTRVLRLTVHSCQDWLHILQVSWWASGALNSECPPET